MITNYIDAHCHLTKLNLSTGIHKLSTAVQFPEKILCNSAHPLDWDLLLDITSNNRNIIPFIGFHPWHVGIEYRVNLSTLKALINQHRHFGIGEIGLDFSDKYKIHKDIQEYFFIEQLNIAKSFNRPVAIHIYKAWHELERLLSKDFFPDNFLIHAFSKSKEIARIILNKGGYISLDKRALLKKNHLELIKWLPLDYILLESDMFLINDQQELKHDYLSHIEHLYMQLATIKGIELSTLKAQIEKNISKFLNGII